MTSPQPQHVYGNIDVPKRVHIVGTGSIGKLIAHAIRGVSKPPPVTIHFHKTAYKDDFEKAGRVIKITTGHNVEERDGFDAELIGSKHDGDQIHNLIVSVKAPDTVSALKPLAHRLHADSTILFMQNGMGVTDDCNQKLFPDPNTRPNYMLGVNSHGVFATSTIAATHAGEGTIMLGLVPRTPSTGSAQGAEVGSLATSLSSRYLLRVITRVPVLAAVALSPNELLQAQVEKLAVNCLINPLTVMMDCHNGDLLNNFAISRTITLLLAEISLVIQSLPELQGVPNVKQRFSQERLQHIAMGIAHRTAKNISSMLQDVRRGSRTEIEYINGYIVKRGEALGIKPVMNYMLMQMVIGKQQMISREADGHLPPKPAL